MMAKYFVVFLLITSLVSIGFGSTPCHVIRACKDFQYRVLVTDEETYGLKTESELAEENHTNGIVPRKYKLDLKFGVDHYFEGDVEIHVDIVQRTDRIYLNVEKTLKIEYRSMTIESKGCDGDRTVEIEGCIGNATFLRDQETVVIDLRGAHLESGSEYVIHFPKYKRPYGTHPGVISEDTEDLAHFVPCFPPRSARTMFPCFDHPMFKTTFDLCVTHDAMMITVSNTPVIADRYEMTKDYMSVDCHETTPSISTASFALALLNRDDYQMQNRTVPSSSSSKSGITIEVFHEPERKTEALRILDWAVKSMSLAEKLTKSEYPLKKFSIIILENSPVPSIGCESLGMVVLDLAHHKKEWESLVFLKIMRQWIGNLVTIRDWRELCLQEGLLDYLNWRFSALRRTETEGSIENLVYLIKNSKPIPDDHVPDGRQFFRTPNHISKLCGMRPPYFFHTLAQFYGGEDLEEGGIVVELLRALIKKHAYGSIGIREWDRTLEELVEGRKYPVTRYFEGWFTQPGMLYLLASKTSRDCIRIRQQIAGSFAPLLQRPRPVPVQLVLLDSSSGHTGGPIVLTELDQQICDLRGAEGFLLDPNRLSWTRKLYSVRNYLYLLRENEKNEHFLPDERDARTTKSFYQMANVIEDFCWGLPHDLFPLADDQSGTVATWMDVAKRIANHTEQTEDKKAFRCHCCMRYISSGGNKKLADNHCGRAVIDRCRKLKLAQIVKSFGEKDEL